jgi:hypothetical protein
MDEPTPVLRDPTLHLAGLHLRLGSLALARAELETLQGHDGLDAGGRIDLAEARWRTGDLVGAGEVARALLDGGEDSLIALVVAAEAAAGLGRPSEARRLASRAMALADGAIDPVFAGMPRSAVWPADPTEPVPSPATLFPTERHVISAPATAEVLPDEPDIALTDPMTAKDHGPGFWDGGDEAQAAPAAEPPTSSEPVTTDPVTAELETAEPVTTEPPDEVSTVPEAPHHVAMSADPGRRLETGRAAIAAGDHASAALHLGLVVRLAPTLAADVLEVIGDHPDSALLVVRGDALRALGREGEARDAYDRAMDGR